DSNEIFIDNLEIPAEDVVGTVGEGFYHLLDSLNPERIVIGIEAVGIGRAANAAKMLAAEAGFNACDAALQTFGGYGYAKEFHVERLWREIRLYKIAPVSQQMALNYLAEHVLGLPRSY